MNLVCLLLFTLLFSPQVEALSVPQLSRPVADLAGVISNDDKNEIENIIHEANDANLVQIAVLIIPSLEEESLEEYSIKVAEKWQLGTAKDDNGILLLIAMKERKIRIEVGNGIEGFITDAYASRRIDEMKPYMRESNYAGAIKNVVASIIETAKNNTPEALATQEELTLKAQQEYEAQQRADAISQAKMKEMFSYIGHGALVLMGIIFLLTNMSKKEQDRIIKDNETLPNKIAEAEMEVAKQKVRFSELKVDQVKLNRIKVVNKTKEMVSTKASLQEKLAQMKRYLGER